MKLLQKKVIDTQKSIERKRDIDEGVELAKKIDTLRRIKAQEEKNLFEWRNTTVAKVQYDIDQRIEELANLDKQCNEARKTRLKLLKPLDNEWQEINEEKEKLAYLDTKVIEEINDLEIEKKQLTKDQEILFSLITKTRKNGLELDKLKSQAISFKDMAHHEYEVAKEEHDSQTRTHEIALNEIAKRHEEYTVALKVIEVREHEVNEKESDLIKKEQHLEKQQRAFEIARQVLETK